MRQIHAGARSKGEREPQGRVKKRSRVSLKSDLEFHLPNFLEFCDEVFRQLTNQVSVRWLFPFGHL